MTTAAELATDGLAVYRLARLVTVDRIGRPLRHWVIRRAYQRSTVPSWCDEIDDPDQRVACDDVDAPPAAYLVSCTWCAAVWCAGAAALIRWVFGPRVWRALARPLAASAAAGIVHEVLES